MRIEKMAQYEKSFTTVIQAQTSYRHVVMMIDLLLFLQKQKLATVIYLFGFGTLLSTPLSVH
jgi:hypothetical protein